MVDIHCHILPEVDDGAVRRSSSPSLIISCRLARQDAIDHIVATPHANEHYAYERHISNAISQDLADCVPFRVGQNSFEIIVRKMEVASQAKSDRYCARLFALGLTPVLTHPERNPILQQDLRRVLEWSEEGCLVQVTASSVTGFWGDAARRCSQWLLEHGAVHVLASDAHDDKYRVPVLSAAHAAVAEVFGLDVAKSTG